MEKRVREGVPEPSPLFDTTVIAAIAAHSAPPENAPAGELARAVEAEAAPCKNNRVLPGTLPNPYRLDSTPVRISAPDDSEEIVHCARNDTVQSLIDVCARHKGVVPSIVRLTVDSERLHPDDLISQLGLRGYQEVDVSFEQTGGGP
jgi:hypothetical protein